MFSKNKKPGFKMNIFLLSGLFLFFGLFVGVESADATLTCCITQSEDCYYSKPGSPTPDKCRVQEAATDCFSTPSYYDYPDLCIKAASNNLKDCSFVEPPDCILLPDKCFFSAKQNKCLNRDGRSCNGLEEPDCSEVGCVFKNGNCVTEAVASGMDIDAAKQQGGSGCANSPLGCIDESRFNKLGLSMKGTGGVQTLIGRVIKIVMGIIGSIALLMFVVGGLMWMTAAGNSEKTARAMRIITWASLGIMVIFLSYALVQFVFSAF